MPVSQGEVYFELTDEVLETFHPGQYDRKIQSIWVHFPDLVQAKLSPHESLIKIVNTRYVPRERDLKRGWNVRKNRYALQSIVLAEAELDTANFDSPEGLIRRFQNTGVNLADI